MFVLREVFDTPYDEIAEAVGKSPAAVRQIAHRARDHVAARRPRMAVSRTEQQAVVERFLAAVTTGDLQGLLDVLAPDVRRSWPTAAAWSRRSVKPVVGAKKVANLLLARFSRLAPAPRSCRSAQRRHAAPDRSAAASSTPRSASPSRTAGSPGSTRSATRTSSSGWARSPSYDGERPSLKSRCKDRARGVPTFRRPGGRRGARQTGRASPVRSEPDLGRQATAPRRRHRQRHPRSGRFSNPSVTASVFPWARPRPPVAGSASAMR